MNVTSKLFPRFEMYGSSLTPSGANALHISLTHKYSFGGSGGGLGNNLIASRCFLFSSKRASLIALISAGVGIDSSSESQ